MSGQTHIYVVLRISIVILLSLALRPLVALAHDGPARIELNRQQTSSGAELEIRGVNIAPELPITLSLVGAGGEYALGTAVGDVHGDFVIGVRLPAEAAVGAYTVRAFGANRVVVTVPLTIVGAAASDEEEGAQRDQGEPLLAPMPRAGGEPGIQPARPAAPRAEPPAAPPVIAIPLWLAVAIGVGLAAIGLAVALRRRAAGASEVVH